MSASLEHSEPRVAVRCRYLIGFQDGEHRLIEDGMLVYRGSTVEYVGPSKDVGDTVVVDASSEIVSPGFVSTHGHYAASPFERGVREDWGNPILYMSGLYEHAVVVGLGVSREIAHLAALFSMAELVSSGVTTGVDMTAWPDETERAAMQLGFRCFVGPYFRSMSWQTDGRSVSWVPLPEGEAATQYDAALAYVRRDRGPSPLVTGCLAPAQLDTCSEELLRAAHRVAREEGRVLLTHGAQAIPEFREILRRSGRTPVEYMSDISLLDAGTVIAHCLFVGGHSWVGYPGNDDLHLLASSGAAVAHCPWVFARYGVGLESFSKYLDGGVRLSIGIDTVPQSMLSEMKTAATVGKFMTRDARAATAREVFDAATLGGAEALGRSDLGRLAPGCAADFVCFTTRSPSMAPLRDPIKNIVYSALPSDVSRVVIAGRSVVEDGRLVGIDSESLSRELQAAAEEVWRQFPRHDHAGRSLDAMTPPSLAAWKQPDRASSALGEEVGA